VKQELHASFRRLTRNFPELMERIRRDTFPQGYPRAKIPEKGVYAFREGAVTWYVGRSDTIPRRFGQHTHLGSPQNQASFAYLLARDEAEAAGMQVRGLTRKALAEKADFTPYFDRAKARVGRMTRHAVEVRDPTEQALFEIYAALALRSKYSDFGNH